MPWPLIGHRLTTCSTALHQTRWLFYLSISLTARDLLKYCTKCKDRSQRSLRRQLSLMEKHHLVNKHYLPIPHSLSLSPHTHTRIYIYIYIILSCRQHGIPWPSPATPPNRSSLLAGLQDYVPYPHWAAVSRFELAALLFLGHVNITYEFVPASSAVSCIIYIYIYYLYIYIYIYILMDILTIYVVFISTENMTYTRVKMDRANFHLQHSFPYFHCHWICIFLSNEQKTICCSCKNLYQCMQPSFSRNEWCHHLKKRHDNIVILSRLDKWQ